MATPAPAVEPKPQYARPAEAAQHLRIGKSTLWQWCGSGPGARPGFPKPIKAGPKVSLFNITAIEAYLKAQAEQVAP
jgi:predicted DNA-binding transcriptional regulator AlpA